MFTAALFIITKNWKQPTYLSTEEYILTMWYIHTIEYYLTVTHKHTHKNNLMKFSGKWLQLEKKNMSEITQTCKDYYSLFIYKGL